MEPGTATAGAVQRRDAAPVVRKGRIGVIVLVAFVVELVVIGALANQVVTKHLVNFVNSHADHFTGHVVAAITTYQWRVTAQPGDRANEPLAHVCLNLVVLALTALLVFTVCRGAVTFARAFFGTWMAVVVSTLFGQIVFKLVSPPAYPRGFSHRSGAVFLGPNGFGFIAGLMLGLVTAIFTAILAVATRRTIRPELPTSVDEYAGPAWWAQDDRDVRDHTLAYPRMDYPQAGYPQGYPQDFEQPLGQPYDRPYPDSHYEGQVGLGGAGPSGDDPAATQQMSVVPDDEQSESARGDDQPTDAIPVEPQPEEPEHPEAEHPEAEHPEAEPEEPEPGEPEPGEPEHGEAEPGEPEQSPPSSGEDVSQHPGRPS